MTLVLPLDQIALLGLPRLAVVRAELGDGSETLLEVYSCLIEWFGHVQQIQAIANTGTSPLLDVGLLQGHTLTIDYVARTLTIDEVALTSDLLDVIQDLRSCVEGAKALRCPPVGAGEPGRGFSCTGLGRSRSVQERPGSIAAV